eukprot:3017077-Rhodomonas_salina.2
MTSLDLNGRRPRARHSVGMHVDDRVDDAAAAHQLHVSVYPRQTAHPQRKTAAHEASNQCKAERVEVSAPDGVITTAHSAPSGRNRLLD